MIFRQDGVEVGNGKLPRINRWILPLSLVLVLFFYVAPNILATRAEDSPEIKQQIEAAKKLAGTDWAPVLDFQLKSGSEIVAMNILPKPTSPAIEPRKVFDNLYVMGQKAVSNFAIITPDGIILIDTGYDGNAEKIILPQMKQLGLNPEDIRYILLTHGHADHFGGAKYFQDHYKNIRVGLSAADWDFIPSQGKGAKPTKDLVLEEGKPITLGGESIMPVSQPGHTPGAMAFIFPVKDFGKPHMVLILGAVQLNPEGVPVATLRQVDESLNHVADAAERMHVDTELAVHPIWDGSEAKMAKISTRNPGEPNPFIVGEENHQRLMKLLDECMKIQIARLSQSGS
jgi:metallo-beta-lactamase class B